MGDDVEEEEKELDAAEEEERAQVSSAAEDRELALRIYTTITSRILPQLHKCLTRKVREAATFALK